MEISPDSRSCGPCRATAGSTCLKFDLEEEIDVNVALKPVHLK